MKLNEEFPLPNIIPIQNRKVPRIIDILINESKKHGKIRKSKSLTKNNGKD